jgi:hypothetical protein
MSVPVIAIAVLRIGTLQIEIPGNGPLGAMSETIVVHRAKLLAAALLTMHHHAVVLLEAMIPVRVDVTKASVVVVRKEDEETLPAKGMRIAIGMRGKQTRTNPPIGNLFASTNLNRKLRLPRRCNRAKNRFARSAIWCSSCKRARPLKRSFLLDPQRATRQIQLLRFPSPHRIPRHPNRHPPIPAEMVT